MPKDIWQHYFVQRGVFYFQISTALPPHSALDVCESFAVARGTTDVASPLRAAHLEVRVLPGDVHGKVKVEQQLAHFDGVPVRLGYFCVPNAKEPDEEISRRLRYCSGGVMLEKLGRPQFLIQRVYSDFRSISIG